jgi:hypothetical protein
MLGRPFLMSLRRTLTPTAAQQAPGPVLRATGYGCVESLQNWGM